ncbi:MAG TPA: hypothetical protein VFA33_26160 [Bryobacteraceae bacterium]|nr:hypothetical protein [Bryobacteraceae bacterium]
MRHRVWEAAHVELKDVTLDSDATVAGGYPCGLEMCLPAVNSPRAGVCGYAC